VSCLHGVSSDAVLGGTGTLALLHNRTRILIRIESCCTPAFDAQGVAVDVELRVEAEQHWNDNLLLKACFGRYAQPAREGVSWNSHSQM
jgi:hypothetical protein